MTYEVRLIEFDLTVDLIYRNCESVAKSIVLIISNDIVPLWCTKEINSCIAGKPPQMFSITHNDAEIPLQNKWIEKLGKKEIQGRENYQSKRAVLFK